ncbi:hypothetical protein GQ54DRAFT_145799 [Martensiomyces pterosporus]|nr:hypothetical protein GQ54DRAFT_145799 [Martensiomyces pterosporus]
MPKSCSLPNWPTEPVANGSDLLSCRRASLAFRSEPCSLLLATGDVVWSAVFLRDPNSSRPTHSLLTLFRSAGSSLLPYSTAAASMVSVFSAGSIGSDIPVRAWISSDSLLFLSRTFLPSYQAHNQVHTRHCLRQPHT